MDNRFSERLIQMLTITSWGCAVCSLLALLYQWIVGYSIESEVVQETLLLTFVAVGFALIMVFLQIYIKIVNRTSNKETILLGKLLSYDKQRREIEEQIELLTKQLMSSDVSKYLDINRLVFSGQNSVYTSKMINFETFFKQFGLDASQLKIKENSAVFLTPFNKSGDQLFQTCQSILSDLDIFLQKTDNRVEKDDILMNIVSLIVQSEIVIANIDGRNPNVYYELGIEHTLGKPTILLSESSSLEDVGFDIRQKRIIIYHSKEDLEKNLLHQINRIRSTH